MGHSPLSIESFNDIMRMIYKDRGLEPFNLLKTELWRILIHAESSMILRNVIS